MVAIRQVLVEEGAGAYYFEDLSAMQAGPRDEPTGIVRELAEAVLVGLILDDGRVAWGDCVGMVPRGSVKSWPTFRAAQGLESIEEVVKPILIGRESGFRELCEEIEALTETVDEERPVPESGDAADEDQSGVEDAGRRALLTAAARLLTPYPTSTDEDGPDGTAPGRIRTETVQVLRPLHPAIRYGVSQALLRAEAMDRGVSMAEVIADEWNLPRPSMSVPIHAQCGTERHLSVDRMVLRRVASLPDAFVENVPEQVGSDSAKLPRYVRWVKQRIHELGDADYHPTIHLDLNGSLGQVFEKQRGPILGQLYAMEFEAKPYALRVVDPVVEDSFEAQIEALRRLRRSVQFRGMSLKLAVGEWANSLAQIQAFIDAGVADVVHIKMPELGAVSNSVEAVLMCHTQNVEAYLGGSPSETELAARVAAHVALATQPAFMLAKPGSGVDEGVSLVQNEMDRTLAWIDARSQ